jgi:putative endonuclease
MAMIKMFHYGHPWRTFKWLIGLTPKFTDLKENGEYGEWLGRKFLKNKGFSILYLNWRSRKDRRYEIDLICMDNEILVFVEIRARSVNSFTTGFQTIGKRKRRALLKSFKAYLSENSHLPLNYRFDVIEVDLPSNGNGKVKLFHHENIAIFKDTLH